MKLYKRATRFQFRRRFGCGRSFAHITWASTLKPGDVVADCSGFNSRIASITPEKRKTRRGWYINDFQIIDTRGGHHYVNGCVWKAESLEQIHGFWLAYTEEHMAMREKQGWNMTFTRAVVHALTNGTPVFDADGVLLPEWDEAMKHRPAEG